MPHGPELLPCCCWSAYDVNYFNNLNTQVNLREQRFYLILLDSTIGLSWLTPCTLKNAYSHIKNWQCSALKKVLAGWISNINHTLIIHATGHTHHYTLRQVDKRNGLQVHRDTLMKSDSKGRYGALCDDLSDNGALMRSKEKVTDANGEAFSLE